MKVSSSCIGLIRIMKHSERELNNVTCKKRRGVSVKGFKGIGAAKGQLLMKVAD